MIKDRSVFPVLFSLVLLLSCGTCFKFFHDFQQAVLLSKACSHALRNLAYQTTHLRSGVDFDPDWVRRYLLPLLDESGQKSVIELFKKEDAEELFGSSSYALYTLREPITLTYAHLQLLLEYMTPQGNGTPRLFILSFVLDNELHDGVTTRLDTLKFLVKELA
ncbi:hypothetical protein [Candidatus Similichlamydia laticola]|uniref:Uncharacterized protein n=1 Tax=Candidatus Similichlamydia laticola TaxID=2170265 RepID=A0A369KE26_9BACT|nr:hypothetical protein [Candidatus Similichlamydia laticola]RDB31157.1 hypothetical protein HAT2_00741 [Candidatus Similichlamydia laticola]